MKRNIMVLNLKKVMPIVGLVLTVCCLTAYTILGFNWNIDADYSIKFSGKKATGTFKGLKGTISFDKNDLIHSKINVLVDVNTINTGNSTKDKHALDDAWFDAETYPTIQFASTSFAKQDDHYTTTGILEMHGVKKEITFPFTFQENASKPFFDGSFKVNRKDFGIKGNMMEFLVGDVFDVSLHIPVSKK